MNLQHNVSFVVFSCLTVGLCGCDPDDGGPITDLQADEHVELLEVIVAPLPGPAPSVDLDVDLARASGASVPVAGGGVGRFAPSDADVIGWMRWALSQPTWTGPVADQTGELCGEGQSGPVWYLAGTFGGPVERGCNVPAGKRLSFPLVNTWCVFPPEFYADEASISADLPAIDAWYQSRFSDVCGLTLRLDGEDLLPDEVMSETLYIQVMDPFTLDLTDEHWATQWFAGGEMPATGAGYYAHLQPLTPGDHVLEFGGEICGEAPFSTYARYELHVGD
jgi:hypothetical protein